MTQRERQILALIAANPMISQQELADTLNITRSSVAVHISNLLKKGYIAGKGYDLNVDIVAHEDMKRANLIFNNQEVINVVAQVMPNADQNDALMKVYGAVSMYPGIKIGMKVAIDLASMMQ